jgi:hypothetical protein
MTLSVPNTAGCSRRSSFNIYPEVQPEFIHDPKTDLLPPTCHEMLSEDAEAFIEDAELLTM